MDLLAAIKGCDPILEDSRPAARSVPGPEAADDPVERRLAAALWGATPRPRPRVRTVCPGC